MLLIIILTFAVRTVKFVRGLPSDIVGQICFNCPDQTLGILSQLNRRLNKDCEEEMRKRRQRIDELAQLVDELERFREIARYHDYGITRYMMDARKEIEHYLNGFETRVRDGMILFHSKCLESDRGVKREIEDFASKLAQHRATYPRLPPHRHADLEHMPLFDAFIKMKDNNMEILRNRMQEDHIMFSYNVKRDLYWEQEAIIEMMRIIESIGIVIDYPGLWKMSDQGTTHGFSEHYVQDVRDHLLGIDDIFKWGRGPGTVVQILSRNSCIGDDETNEIVKNIREFVKLWSAQTGMKQHWS